ncbi:winged helix-turn-helix transcriptional regulator [Chryseobacterium sp. GP-SGM7]|uniref:winged helix-turn-helix transcriptional regulator n=1 Tax=Chryseobacterium sp. GP-SGM7 TaxID=3411323 RepID=UPI003B95C4B4
MKKEPEFNNNLICKKRILAIKDTMEILSGKWKFHILGTLMLGNKLRFMDLVREVDGIGSKMLSKELQDLEMNHLIMRTVLDTKPITVEYQITEHGKTLSSIIDEIANWGIDYRDKFHKKTEQIDVPRN